MMTVMTKDESKESKDPSVDFGDVAFLKTPKHRIMFRQARQLLNQGKNEQAGDMFGQLLEALYVNMLDVSFIHLLVADGMSVAPHIPHTTTVDMCYTHLPHTTTTERNKKANWQWKQRLCITCMAWHCCHKCKRVLMLLVAL